MKPGAYGGLVKFDSDSDIEIKARQRAQLAFRKYITVYESANDGLVVFHSEDIGPVLDGFGRETWAFKIIFKSSDKKAEAIDRKAQAENRKGV